jgi:hypothetical protein
MDSKVIKKSSAKKPHKISINFKTTFSL